MDDKAQTMEFTVEGMNCSHCSGSIKRAVSELDGVTDCQVSLDDGRAVVRGSGFQSETVAVVIESLGFKTRLSGGPDVG